MTVTDLLRICGITQKTLAEWLNVTPRTLQYVDSGKLALSESLAQRISDQTGCGWEIREDGVHLTPKFRKSDLPFTRDEFLQWREWAEVRNKFQTYLEALHGTLMMALQASAEKGQAEKFLDSLNRHIEEFQPLRDLEEDLQRVASRERMTLESIRRLPMWNEEKFPFEEEVVESSSVIGSLRTYLEVLKGASRQ